MRICLDQRTGSGCEATNDDDATHCKQCGMPLKYAMELQNPGTVIGSYRIIHIIGYGSFGAVYRAEDREQPGRQVAVKETFNPASIRAFRGEFAVLHRLQHEHLPQYYDMFEAEGNGYLVMELIPGQSLLDVIEQQEQTGQPLPEAQVVGYAIQVCDALTYLHSQDPPLIHRDIKPANIRITPNGLIKLVDFGLIKQGTNKTGSSRLGLTPAYAPLEQWGGTGERTSPQSDIYSVAATLYQLLTGKPPHVATDRSAAEHDPLIPPHKLNPKISQHMSDALMQALSIRPTDRFTDAETFKHAMITPMPKRQKSGIMTVPVTPQTAKRTIPRWLLGIGAVAVLVVLAIGAIVWYKVGENTSHVSSPIVSITPDITNASVSNNPQPIAQSDSESKSGQITIPTTHRSVSVDHDATATTRVEHTATAQAAEQMAAARAGRVETTDVARANNTATAQAAEQTDVARAEQTEAAQQAAAEQTDVARAEQTEAAQQTAAVLNEPMMVFLVNNTIATINGNGDIEQLPVVGTVNTPRLSPDGTRIVFESNSQIHMVDSNGRNQQQLTFTGHNHHPAWSPDGTQIAFHTDRDGDWEIYTMNTDGSKQRNLTNDHGWNDVQPAWSSDGSKIAFASHPTDLSEELNIYVMNSNGKNAKQLTNDLSKDEFPCWSPDGTQIAFTAKRAQDDNKNHIYVISDFNTIGDEHLLTEQNGSYCSWSSDGRIAFTCGNNICTVDAHGNDLQKTFTTGEKPSWRSLQ